MEETFSEFCTRVARKRESGRKFKVSNSWGVYDAYKALRKHKWLDIGRPLKEHEFYTIVRKMNELIAEEIASGRKVTLPSRMGTLELRKFERGAFLIDGKLVVTYPIDWMATMRLWYKDGEARKSKTLVRYTSKEIYKVWYNKYNANYPNKKFYEFSPVRSLQKKIHEKIVKDQVKLI